MFPAHTKRSRNREGENEKNEFAHRCVLSCSVNSKRELSKNIVPCDDATQQIGVMLHGTQQRDEGGTESKLIMTDLKCKLKIDGISSAAQQLVSLCRDHSLELALLCLLLSFVRLGRF